MADKNTILITGTRKGIGKKLAKYYCDKDWNVIGLSRGSSDLELENYKHYKADITSEKAVKNVFLSIRKEYKKVDFLINNAGMASMNHSLLTPKSTALNIMNTNFLGTFLVSREAAKVMIKNRFGRIINITTVGTQIKLEGEAIYTASKAAVENLTIVLSRELAQYGITVNGIGPTPALTDLIRFVPEEKIKNIVDSLAFDRLTQIEDIINVSDFFISRKSDFITGQIIFLGGG